MVAAGSAEHRAELEARWRAAVAGSAQVLEGLDERPVPRSMLGAPLEAVAAAVGAPLESSNDPDLFDSRGAEEDPREDLRGGWAPLLPATEVPRRLFKVLTVVQRLHAVDHCPMAVLLAALLARYCPDAAVFAVLDRLLKTPRRALCFDATDGMGLDPDLSPHLLAPPSSSPSSTRSFFPSGGAQAAAQCAAMHLTLEALLSARLPATVACLVQDHFTAGTTSPPAPGLPDPPPACGRTGPRQAQ